MSGRQTATRRVPNRRLRDARARKGWSQEELGRRSKTSLGTVNKAERGTHVPHAVTQEKIARALGIPRDMLFPEEAA